MWTVHVNGDVIGCAPDPSMISFVMYRGPFHPISEDEYMAIVRDYAEAQPGSPLKTPDKSINLRQTKPL